MLRRKLAVALSTMAITFGSAIARPSVVEGQTVASALDNSPGFRRVPPPQTGVPASASGHSHTGLWTAVGAGAGFGLGLWAGLHAFDDAVDSERKVWTTAILSAAAGGVLAYLLSRNDSRPPAQRVLRGNPLRVTRLSVVDAPALGSGAFHSWRLRWEQSAFGSQIEHGHQPAGGYSRRSTTAGSIRAARLAGR